MTKLIAAKISTLVAALTTSLILSGCETTSGKPELCKTNPRAASCVKAKVVKPKVVKAKAAKVNKVSRSESSHRDY